jgi:hypothetical protein
VSGTRPAQTLTTPLPSKFEHVCKTMKNRFLEELVYFVIMKRLDLNFCSHFCSSQALTLIGAMWGDGHPLPKTNMYSFDINKALGLEI